MKPSSVSECSSISRRVPGPIERTPQCLDRQWGVRCLGTSCHRCRSRAKHCLLPSHLFLHRQDPGQNVRSSKLRFQEAVPIQQEKAVARQEARVVGQQVGRLRDGMCCSKRLDDGVLQDMFRSQSPSMMWIGAAYCCSRVYAMMDHTPKLQRPRNRRTAVSNDDGERYPYCLMMTMIFRNFVGRKECPEDLSLIHI